MPDKRHKYDEAFKAEGLRLATESRSTQAAPRQLGISPELLYRWQQAQLVAEVSSKEVARDPEVRALRARLKRAEQELDILKKPWLSSAWSAGSASRNPVSSYRYIAQRASQLPVRQLCQVLRVAPAAYYNWQRRQQVPAIEPGWQVAVREAFADHSQRYGTHRARPSSPARSRRARPIPTWPCALLLTACSASWPPTALNRLWVGDTTYLPYWVRPRQGGGWLYLAVWLACCSRKIVGWDVGETMPEDLVSEALRQALVVPQPPVGLVVHSD